jgi:predicted acetyltransferase
MTFMKLVRPSVKYKKSFLQDFLKHSEMQETYSHTGFLKEEVSERFPEFVRRLNGQSKGLYLPKGLIPQSVFWLVDGNTYIGKLDIRHKLNKKLRNLGGHIGYYIRPDKRRKGYGRQILRLGLLKAKQLGIKNALITCDITNVGSKKIIEANGGKFAGKFKNKTLKVPKLRFWITVK